MSQQQQEYLRLAAAARLDAASVTLDNVRQKLLLSAVTWEGLAHTAGKLAHGRAQRLLAATTG
jgi:hypothetical protein